MVQHVFTSPHPRRTAASDDGFTLVELLIVIVIIGILAAIAVPIFTAERSRAVDTSIKSDLRQAAIQMQSGFVETQVYPRASAVTISGSTGNVILGKVTDAGDAYCLEGYNRKGTATTELSNAFWYDSSGGGLKAVASSLPSGGACAAPGGRPVSATDRFLGLVP